MSLQELRTQLPGACVFGVEPLGGEARGQGDLCSLCDPGQTGSLSEPREAVGSNSLCGFQTFCQTNASVEPNL